jgi:hypothetical protein
MATVEIVGPPTDTVPNFLELAGPASEFETRRDELQEATEALGRSNTSYEHIWKAVREADGKWVTLRCNSVRRAILLASSALQHRTQAHQIKRRGRMVCLRLDPRDMAAQRPA